MNKRPSKLRTRQLNELSAYLWDKGFPRLGSHDAETFLKARERYHKKCEEMWAAASAGAGPHGFVVDLPSLEDYIREDFGDLERHHWIVLKWEKIDRHVTHWLRKHKLLRKSDG